jgi:hypothetical protein
MRCHENSRNQLGLGGGTLVEWTLVEWTLVEWTLLERNLVELHLNRTLEERNLVESFFEANRTLVE